MRRRTVCLYLDSGLLEEARKTAEAQGASLSELAEEAISLYLQLLGRLGRAPPRSARGRPAAEAPTARPPQPSAPSPPPTTPPAAPPAPQLPPSAPPHLQNNAWVAVLRSRR